MTFLKYGAITLISLTFLLLLILYAKGGKMLKRFLTNALFSVGIMVIINLTSFFTGVHIPVNQWTGIGTAIFGLPALCGFILLPLIFG